MRMNVATINAAVRANINIPLTPLKKPFSLRINAIRDAVKIEFPIEGVEGGWERYYKEPHAHPELTRALANLGYENPFEFEGGPAGRFAARLARKVADPYFAATLLISGIRNDIWNECLSINRGKGFEKAFTVLRHSYHFVDAARSLGFDAGLMTGLNPGLFNPRYGDLFNNFPSAVWMRHKKNEELYKFNFASLTALDCMAILFTSFLHLATSGETEISYDSPAEIFAYHHYLKSQMLEEDDQKTLSEAEIVKAYAMSPRRSYLYPMKADACSLIKKADLRPNIMEEYINGDIDIEGKAAFEALADEHPVVRAVFQLKLDGK